MHKGFRAICLFFGMVCTLACAAQDPLQLLRSNNVKELDHLLTNVQQQFEQGSLSETELRNAYRPFYELDEQAAGNLTRWVSDFPTSYVAHLALGIYFKKRGLSSRGDEYIANTSTAEIAEMSKYYGAAVEALRASLSLTAKPFLSVFHLMTISTQFGDRAQTKALLSRANAMLPTNSLVRNRYATSLTPRWGGNYEELRQFIEDTKNERLPPSVVIQLEALEQEDLGLTDVERGRNDAALRHFRESLKLAETVKGTFAADFLNIARYYGCPWSLAPLSCQ